jgi:hypothetical protein
MMIDFIDSMMYVVIRLHWMEFSIVIFYGDGCVSESSHLLTARSAISVRHK